MDELRISLSLPTPVAPGTLYRVELDSGLQSRSVKIDAQDLNSLLVVVPARDVPPGYYALKLFATSSGTEHPLPGDYRFIVE
jgi:methionine-rich copper-binding protein CopC